MPEDYHRFALTSQSAGRLLHAFREHARLRQPARGARRPERHDTQSHGHYHYVYRDPESNYHNLERADRLLEAAGFEPSGFAGPHGRWNPGLDDALESLGYEYSSDFQLGYDDFPFFPWKAGRFSRVLQVPVHPVCEGLFLDLGIPDSRVVANYLCRVVAAKMQGGEPALVYGHPERRLGKMPEILIALHRLAAKAIAGLADHLDRTGAAVALARRPASTWSCPGTDNQFEIQFEDWDDEVPAGHRDPARRLHCLVASLLVPRTLIDARRAGLRTARCAPGPA